MGLGRGVRLKKYYVVRLRVKVKVDNKNPKLSTLS